MEIITILIVLCGLFVGWTIGANDAANCLGTSVGAGLIDYKKAVVIVALFAFLGAVTHGQATTATVGSGIIDSSSVPLAAIIAVLFSASLFVTAITILGLPISSTQAVIGGIAGVGLVISADVSWATVAKIFFLGFVTPVIALLCSFFIYSMYGRIIRLRSFLFIEKFLGWAVLLSGAFLAYSLGANNLGNAMGLVVGSNSLPIFLASVLGGTAIALGSITLGKRVMKTVGNDITELSAQTAFAAQAGCAISIYMLTLIGIPTSTSFGIVGGVAGVGLVKGVGMLNKHTLKKIALGWVVTPVISALLAIVIYLIASRFI
ncbi:MAG: inorganic phosphate transporter [Candidatus Nanoarchaeia archaeon]|nr:inorganic phosphate transporter [Candidatus Nanoarchaeia archaeon]